MVNVVARVRNQCTTSISTITLYSRKAGWASHAFNEYTFACRLRAFRPIKEPKMAHQPNHRPPINDSEGDKWCAGNFVCDVYEFNLHFFPERSCDSRGFLGLLNKIAVAYQQLFEIGTSTLTIW